MEKQLEPAVEQKGKMKPLSPRPESEAPAFPGDRVISLCDRVREVCPEFPGQPVTLHWSIPDPAAEPGDNEASYPTFQQTASELETRMRFLVAALTTQTNP
jgi:protein-tyrosine-phosphatase